VVSGAARIRPKTTFLPRNKLAKIFHWCFTLIFNCSKITEGTVGLETTSVTGSSRTKFLTALLAVEWFVYGMGLSHWCCQGRPWQVRGPIGSTFAEPHSVACAETFEEHQVIMIEIGDVKERGAKWLLPPVSPLSYCYCCCFNDWSSRLGNRKAPWYNSRDLRPFCGAHAVERGLRTLGHHEMTQNKGDNVWCVEVTRACFAE